MATDEFFIRPDPKSFYRFAPTTDNGATVFYDNPALYQSMLRDLLATRHSYQFVYFAGWWSDLRLPMGDPKASKTPPTFGDALRALMGGLLVPAAPGQSAPTPTARYTGPQICCMLWQHKGQKDWSGLPGALLPVSIFGAPVLASINTALWKAVNNSSTLNRAVLDKAHALFGSHHQKFTVMLTDSGLVAYIGSSDYNTDRLYAEGDTAAPVASGKGAPLNDVSVRLTGPAAVDTLTTFLDRWRAHPDGKGLALTGENYTPTTSAPNQGTVRAQLSHTYAKDYPFAAAVRSAADTHENICRAAKNYLYFEDQYMIGTPGMRAVLRDKLMTNADIVVVAVMAPLSVVGDLPWLEDRRSEFWEPLVTAHPRQVLLFEMLAPDGTDSGPGAYLHNKMTIADDTVVTMGSVNFSQRSHTHDSELMVTLGGESAAGAADIALQVRAQRWARHLGERPGGETPKLADAIAAFRRVPGRGGTPGAARIRRWTPTNVTWPKLLSPNGGPFGTPVFGDPLEYAEYRAFYNTVGDPA